MRVALIVEDEPEPRSLLTTCLRTEGWHVEAALDGVEASKKTQISPYQLIVLDLMLPRMNGEEFLKSFRKYSTAPVVVVSGRMEPEDRVRVLDLGADDYLTKPFYPDEFKARVRAVTRRENGESRESPDSFQTKGFEIEFKARRVKISGNEVPLNSSMFEVLRLLVLHHGEVVPFEKLFKYVWGDLNTELHTLQVVVSSLRKALGQYHDLIENVHGIGYRFLA